MASLSEALAQKRLEVADRETVKAGLVAASMSADVVGLKTEGIFESLAQGREKTDPDYWTFKIMQYLYEYLPSRYLVPVFLGLGLWKAFELAQQLVEWFWNEYGKGWWESAKTSLGIKDSVARDFDGLPGANLGTAALQAGLMANLPPYAQAAVTMLANRSSAPSRPVVAPAQTYVPYAPAVMPQQQMNTRPVQPQQQQQVVYQPQPQQPQEWWQNQGLVNAGVGLIGGVIDALGNIGQTVPAQSFVPSNPTGSSFASSETQYVVQPDGFLSGDYGYVDAYTMEYIPYDYNQYMADGPVRSGRRFKGRAPAFDRVARDHGLGNSAGTFGLTNTIRNF